MLMPQDILVSIIIPCKNVDDYTRECIEHCKQLNYANYEIILLPDDSKDAIEGVRVIPTGSVTPGVKRNIGGENSEGDFCAFIDSDAYPPNDWLANAMKYFEDPEVAGVGGPGLTPEMDCLMQRAGGYVLSSFMMGSLSSRYRILSRGETKRGLESNEIHSCNFIARKSVVQESGGWNEKYWPGEDGLMCLAIKQLGKKLIESSNVVVYHHRRPLFRPHLKQISRFGTYRGLSVRRSQQNSLKPAYFFPSLLVLSLFIGVSLSFLFPFFRYIIVLGLALYLALGFGASILQVRKVKLIFLIWVGIIVTHITYGLSFLYGLVKSDLKR
ncbi:MAG TPA: glycosyltransferase [Candidatus Bathyarchaeia archaeon]|nr:glycosyltransferase [Candidatus Bathyarchaeia archaeon]